MADAEYHRKQADLLAGLALSTSDKQEAAGLSRLAAEHMNRADQSSGNASSENNESRDLRNADDPQN
jgi:hypothetical protein